MSKNNNDVGYRKPPRHSRFKKGESGNSAGRPKGTRNFKSDVQSALQTRVRVTKDGAQKKVSAQEAALLRLCEKALGKGELKAIEQLLGLARTYNDDEPDLVQPATINDEDKEILKAFINRGFPEDVRNDLTKGKKVKTRRT